MEYEQGCPLMAHVGIIDCFFQGWPPIEGHGFALLLMVFYTHCLPLHPVIVGFLPGQQIMQITEM